ncbi:AimR family lysis-lysogeny pheromone receptor [Aquibacillus kalidii]|uniref:AimR family lysis-lysogeny pheromone receptor n=1 Tax=Aquibacillus kalidii TaxID=2762597 RepID=UPI00164724DB|nr:AimR family lysis-lysogeny pheromone receptor [Aquibacillus kalidii]
MSVNQVNTWEDFIVNNEELSLFHVFQMVKLTENAESALHIVRDLCLQSNSDENLRIGLEFLYSNGFLAELKQLIDINRSSQNKLNQKWAKVYQIMRNRRLKVRGNNKYEASYYYLDEINTIEADEVEIQCLRDLLRIFCYFDLKQYNKIGKYSDQVLSAIQKIDNLMLKELLAVRLDEAFVIYHWKRSEMILARKFGYRILNTTHNWRKKIDIHNLMALGFLFDSYEQAMYHAKVALEIATQQAFLPAVKGLTNFTIPFLSAYFGRTEGVSSSDKAEQAHLALARGDKETCISILSSFETLSPFQKYYLGKATQDESLLRESYHHFIHENNDYFYARLPLNELTKLKVTQ